MTKKRRKVPRYQQDNPNVEKVFLRHKLIAKSRNQKDYIKSVRDNSITFCNGPAGSGKTHIAVGCAVYSLINGHVDKIVITRPVVQAGERLGYLPGTADKKLEPYVLPIFDELSYFVSHEQIARWKNESKLEIAPIGLMRGRNFHNSFIIGDECQNLSSEQIRMFLTRMGMESKLIITGDESQSDLPKDMRGAFSDCLNKLTGIPEVGIINLRKEDIVRNPLIPVIIERLQI